MIALHIASKLLAIYHMYPYIVCNSFLECKYSSFYMLKIFFNHMESHNQVYLKTKIPILVP